MQGGKAKPNSWWQKIKIFLEIVGVIIALMLLAVLIILIVQGYKLNWEWVGVGPYTTPVHPQGTDFQRNKTLWDWLQLLIIPVVLAIGGYLFNLTVSRNEQSAAANRDKTEREIALDNQQEATLQEYINKMSELLLDKKLRESTENDEVQKIARVRTLTVLPRLDKERKKSVLQFLFEAGLIKDKNNIVNLSGADPSGAKLSRADLSGADLYRANLYDADLSGAYLNDAKLSRAILYRAILYRANLGGANLFGADLSNADLSNADLSTTLLSGAILSRADLFGAKLSLANLSEANLVETGLRGADLGGTDLRGANLSGADLSKANLSGADLFGVNLSDADLSGADLGGANLKGTTMPDGTVHP